MLPGRRYPRVNDRIMLVNPDTQEREISVVTGRAGKAGAANRNWFNLQNNERICRNNERMSVNVGEHVFA